MSLHTSYSYGSSPTASFYTPVPSYGGQTATWVDKKGGNVMLQFQLAPNGYLIAQLFQKHVNNTFVPAEVIHERNMTIEIENLHALMRGIPQKTFNLSMLNPNQKSAILGSLEPRHIDVIRGFGPEPTSIVINALP